MWFEAYHKMDQPSSLDPSNFILRTVLACDILRKISSEAGVDSFNVQLPDSRIFSTPEAVDVYSTPGGVGSVVYCSIVMVSLPVFGSA